MSTMAKLLARKWALLERLESDPGPNEREEIERLLAQLETALTDAEGRKAAYVPLSRDGKVVDSAAVVEKLKDCKDGG